MSKYITRIFIICLILLITISSTIYAQTSLLGDKKDPLFAASLSWYIPGAGLIYTENWFRGMLYFGIEYAILFYGMASVIHVNFDPITFSFTFNPPINPTSEDYFNITLWSVLYFAVHMVCVIDSAITAEQYNTKNQENLKNVPPTPILASLLSWMYPGLGQIYAKAYFKGSIFMLVDLLEKAAMGIAIVTTFYPDPEAINEPFNISWTELSTGEKIFLASYISIYFLNRIISSYTAYYDAKNSYQYYDNSNYSFYIVPQISSTSIGLFICANFGKL